MLAVALGRPLGIDDADCDIELPLDIDDVALPAYFASQNSSPTGSTPTTTSWENMKPNASTSPSLMKGFNALTCFSRSPVRFYAKCMPSTSARKIWTPIRWPSCRLLLIDLIVY